MDWQRKHKEYGILKNLSVLVAMLINQPTKETPDSTLAARQLTEITVVDSKAWKHEAGKEGTYWFEQLSDEEKKNIL
jgi:hypothetical protein